jgi:putative FmdB family regulatory protein
VPTYQYACTVADCGHEFDTVQTFSDTALTECPECSGRLRKVWGSIGVVFKGSGFYRNDSRETSKNGDGKNGDSKSGTQDSAQSKSDPKASSDNAASAKSTKSAGESNTTTTSPSKAGSDSSSGAKRKPAAAAS